MNISERSFRCVVLYAANRSTLRDLHIQGCVNGVELYTPTSGATYSDITITGLFFADIRVDYATYSPADSRWGKALEIGIGSGVLSNFSLSNCVGIRMDTFFSQVTTIDGLNLIGNTVAQCGGNCYFVGSVHNLVMRDSVFLRDTPANLFLYGTTDIVNIPPRPHAHAHALAHTCTHMHTLTHHAYHVLLTTHTPCVTLFFIIHPSTHRFLAPLLGRTSLLTTISTAAGSIREDRMAVRSILKPAQVGPRSPTTLSITRGEEA